jgi:hypothetical protein
LSLSVGVNSLVLPRVVGGVLTIGGLSPDEIEKIATHHIRSIGYAMDSESAPAHGS